MKHLFPFLLLFLPLSAVANEFAPFFQWTGPDEFESGQLLDPLTDLSEYRLYCTPAIPAQTMPNTDNSWQAPFGLFPPGDYDCHMTAVGLVALGSRESAESNNKLFTVVADRPGPVVTFEVN